MDKETHNKETLFWQKGVIVFNVIFAIFSAGHQVDSNNKAHYNVGTPLKNTNKETHKDIPLTSESTWILLSSSSLLSSLSLSPEVLSWCPQQNWQQIPQEAHDETDKESRIETQESRSKQTALRKRILGLHRTCFIGLPNILMMHVCIQLMRIFDSYSTKIWT